MRLKITLDNVRETGLPVNYQPFLTAALYGLLRTSDTDYARFLHDEGYRSEEGDKRFKLFVFSNLRAARRRIIGDTLWIGSGSIEWYIASPLEMFLGHIATGLLAAGAVQVGSASFPICQVEALPTADLSSGAAKFICLSAIVAAVALEGGGTRYLRPAQEGEAFSEAVRHNLLNKYRTLTSGLPADDRFQMVFDAGYLERHRGGTKKITFKNIDVIGVQAPFAASGSAELLRVMLECGAGEKNAGGFGMVEVRH